MTAICGWSNVAKWFPWPYLWPASLPGPPSFDSHATKVQNSRRKQAVRDRAPLTFHFSWSKIIPSLLLFYASSSGGGNPPLPPRWPIERCSADNIAPQAQPQIETALFEPVMDTEIDRARTILRKGLLICGGRSACALFVYRVNCDPYPRIGNRCNASSTTLPSPSFRPVSFPSLSRWTRGRLDEVFSFLNFFFFFFWKRKVRKGEFLIAELW